MDIKETIFYERDECNRSLFNQEIKENALPLSLQTLTFGCFFNQEIKENVLPSSLQILELGFYYDQEIKGNVLPLSLQTLKICAVNSKIKIPKCVTELYIASVNNSINNLLINNEKLYIKFVENVEKIDNLPIALEEIIIEKEEYKKYFLKIPFGCKITIKKIDYYT